MTGFYSKHYITVDEQSRIISGWSDGPRPGRDTSGAVCINEQGGYPFRLAPDGEENPVLTTTDGIPLYKWDGEKVVKRADEEVEADRAARPVAEIGLTEVERLRADVDYIAIMTGVEL